MIVLCFAGGFLLIVELVFMRSGKADNVEFETGEIRGRILYQLVNCALACCILLPSMFLVPFYQRSGVGAKLSICLVVVPLWMEGILTFQRLGQSFLQRTMDPWEGAHGGFIPEGKRKTRRRELTRH